MSEKYYSRLAVNLLLMRYNEKHEKEILLQLRQNTGYMDNMYDFGCSGHVDKNESYSQALVREAKEEIGIFIKEEDLVFLAVNHNYKADHVQLYFTAKEYKGTPTVCEPDECGGLLWANINSLPSNTREDVVNVIKCVQMGIQFDDGDFTHMKNALQRKGISFER
ncbi:MAG: NUDIX domain-containing protein [Clostridia bacterium]|nr:NUDIX domain-containing protein [Clostridia bacterium]